MASTFSEFFNAGHDLHFRQSRLKLFGIFIMCAAVTTTLGVLGYSWVSNSFSEGWHWRFRCMAALFVLITMFTLYLLANAHAKGVILTKTGVTDHRISSQEIHWLRIDAVNEARHMSSRFLVLRLTDAKIAPRNLLQTLESMVLGLGDTERTISAAGLDVSYKTFVEAIVAGWLSSRHARPFRNIG